MNLDIPPHAVPHAELGGQGHVERIFKVSNLRIGIAILYRCPLDSIPKSSRRASATSGSFAFCDDEVRLQHARHGIAKSTDAGSKFSLQGKRTHWITSHAPNRNVAFRRSVRHYHLVVLGRKLTDRADPVDNGCRSRSHAGAQRVSCESCRSRALPPLGHGA